MLCIRTIGILHCTYTVASSMRVRGVRQGTMSSYGLAITTHQFTAESLSYQVYKHSTRSVSTLYP